VLIAGDRVLVKDQTLSQNNGIYLCAAGAWTRTTDADTWDELTSAFTFIETGTVNADCGFVCTANAGGTLGTTALPWSQFSGAGSYTASTGLTLTGTVFSLTAPVTVALGGTNATSAGIAAFNNISGFTAAGATGTTSTNLVFSTSPTLVTPALGTPSSATLTNATGLPLTTGVTGTLPVANGGTGVTTSTGTTNVVLSGSPTITTPVIAQINDASGNETLKLASIASAVNEVTIENAPSGSAVHISASGGDASVGLHLAGKGASGYVNVQDSTDATKRIMFNAAGGTTNTRTMLSSTQTVDRTLSLPDATDTLVGKATTDTLTNKTITGGILNGTLGSTTPSTIAGTTITATSAVTMANATALQFKESGGTARNTLGMTAGNLIQIGDIPNAGNSLEVLSFGAINTKINTSTITSVSSTGLAITGVVTASNGTYNRFATTNSGDTVATLVNKGSASAYLTIASGTTADYVLEMASERTGAGTGNFYFGGNHTTNFVFRSNGYASLGNWNSTALSVTGSLSATSSISNTTASGTASVINIAQTGIIGWNITNEATTGLLKIGVTSGGTILTMTNGTGLAVTGTVGTSGNATIGTAGLAPVATPTRLTLDGSYANAGTPTNQQQKLTLVSVSSTEAYGFAVSNDGGLWAQSGNSTGATGYIGFATGGAERGRINSTGLAVTGTTTSTGAISTAATGEALTLNSGGTAADTYLKIKRGSGTYWTVGHDSLGGLTFGRDGTDKAYFGRNSVDGLYVIGTLTCTGALSKGSGSFRIEHPLPSKSATHQLVHSFIEGPKCDLIYRGKINLVDGKASVNIDTDSTMTEGTFEVLCANVQCFTSNESGWGAIRGKVTGNILTIEAQDAASTDNVSWMVIGERKDPHIMDTDWTDENGRPIVEPLKPAEPALEAK
jgi:hypothetical protein